MFKEEGNKRHEKREKRRKSEEGKEGKDRGKEGKGVKRREEKNSLVKENQREMDNRRKEGGKK